MKKCIYAKLCGGCNLQGLDYSQQLATKQKYVNSLLNRFGNVKPILGMDNIYNYRNKVQVSFTFDDNNNVVSGNYEPSSHSVVPINECMICDKRANEIITSVTKLINKYKISIFDENSMRGCMRHLLIRCSKNGEYMLVLVTGSVNINKKALFIDDILKYNPDISTIVQNINNKHTSMILSDKEIILYGKGYISDILCGLKFNISSSSFYQVNKYQTEVLYKQAINAANLNKDDIVIDAYCGTGTIGLVASKYCKQVYGVEINKHAVRDAINNAKINHIKNCYFINEDAGNFMNELSKNKEHVDVLIMDPPRTGSDTKFLNSVTKLRPNKIVYVSCNPETLARDLLILQKSYKVKSIQPVDMFAFTNHVECVTLLEKV